LNGEVRKLLELLSRETGGVGAVAADRLARPAEKLLEYNESIANKGSRIFDLLPMRLERRLQSGAPPISDEFRAILGLLEKGCMTVVRLNGNCGR
jgi:hypothetical protein